MNRHSKTLSALWCSGIVLFILFSLPVLAKAERIVPSDRVTSYVNVREQPSTQSVVVGRLSPNESAELLEGVPYWYHVRLSNGVTGYVSKAWSVKVSEAVETGRVIRLGSWNIKKLGHGSSKDYALLAQVIGSNFDVLAVVEVMQKQGGHPGYDALLSALGPDWDGLVTDSPRPNTGAGHSEFYAVLYRQGLLRPCADWDALVYYEDNDGSGSDTGEDVFSREPGFGCFEAPLNDSSIGIDFLLGAYHARWDEGHIEEISDEVDHVDEVFTAMQQARPGEGDIIIAGDFNLVPQKLREEVTVEVNTQGTGSTLNSQGERTTNLYDHILVLHEQETSEMIGSPEVLDVIGQATSPQVFFDTVSDHLPVFVRLRAFGPDDD
ncbi:SH3 domain-containing protein [Thermodesulfobacteriota bacterium]